MQKKIQHHPSPSDPPTKNTNSQEIKSPLIKSFNHSRKDINHLEKDLINPLDLLGNMSISP